MRAPCLSLFSGSLSLSPTHPPLLSLSLSRSTPLLLSISDFCLPSLPSLTCCNTESHSCSLLIRFGRGSCGGNQKKKKKHPRVCACVFARTISWTPLCVSLTAFSLTGLIFFLSVTTPSDHSCLT